MFPWGMPHLCSHMKRLDKDDMAEWKKKGGSLVTPDFHKFCCNHPIQDTLSIAVQSNSMQKDTALKSVSLSTTNAMQNTFSKKEEVIRYYQRVNKNKIWKDIINKESIIEAKKLEAEIAMQQLSWNHLQPSVKSFITTLSAWGIFIQNIESV